jgi:DNA-binding NarL/FixJ family response regulator
MTLDGRTGEPRKTLSPREAQIIALICEEGLSNAEIAVRLNIGTATTKVYLSNAKDKLGTEYRATLKFVVAYWKKRLHDELAESTGVVDMGTS